MAAMLSQVTRNVGFMLRETGQAMDRLGCKVMGDYAFMEQLSRHRKVMGVHDVTPVLGEGAFVAPNASVIGDVSLGASSSVWYGSVLRGDSNNIAVGDETALFDRVLVSPSATGPTSSKRPAVIGSRVNIGPGSILHACTIGDEAIVGAGATVLDGATIEKHGMLDAGSVLAPGATVKSGEMWAGAPAKMVSKVDAATIDFYKAKTSETVKLAAVHLAEHSKSLDLLVAEDEARKRRAGISDEYATQMGIRTQLDQAGQARTARQTLTF